MRLAFAEHRGNGRRFAEALHDAGYELLEAGYVGPGLDTLVASHDIYQYCDWYRHIFVYPHGAGVVATGDGQWPTHPSTRGMFVIGEGQAEVLRRSAYPRPVQVVGWPFCDQRPFRAGTADRVLFAPSHPWLSDEQKDINSQVHDQLAACTADLTVRHLGPLQAVGIRPQRHVRYVEASGDIDDTIGQIDDADVVVAGEGTFPSLAVARGCPTVMVNQGRLDDFNWAEQRPARCRHWDDYRDYIHYPLDSLDDLERAAKSDVDIAEWRKLFVGEPMTGFAAHFRRALEDW